MLKLNKTCMNKQDILNNISRPSVTAEIIAEAIRKGKNDLFSLDSKLSINEITKVEYNSIVKKDILSFKDALDTGVFHPIKQKAVKDLLLNYHKEDIDFQSSITLQNLREFCDNYPNSIYTDHVNKKIRDLELEERENQKQRFEYIKLNINDYKPDELINELGADIVRDLCTELGIDYQVVLSYDEPELKFNDIPQTVDEIPTGYTDVFFWGIPSSGKTCALATILRTMKDKYTITSPSLEKKFGTTYRDSLINIFNNQTAYLPAATQKDRTQYMPLLLKRRNEDKYRQISFFELSGEVFKYFHELEYNSNILADDDRGNIEKAFETLDILLSSKNQKIHFFFIDYQQETKGVRDKHNLTQENYLNAAASYFRDRKDIFKKKTDAVYVVVTKSDQIKSDVDDNISGEIRAQLAGRFLSDNFGTFIDVIKHRCKKDSVDFNVKIFSIGDVYFKSICKINYYYAVNIVEDLLNKVRPAGECRISNWFNS